jgi:acyl-[acyl-carrier-protein]-phospholipid O-acyltransferase / long-chain-fatty-acid--[acyl-carrier-protein] ligase
MLHQTLTNVSQAGAAPPPSHPLRALLMAQFFGAFNDNVYKMVVSLLAVQETLKAGVGSAALALVSAVFIIPFLLFSGYAGHAADVLRRFPGKMLLC